MALSDFETFIKERMAVFDDTEDLSPGSPFDTQVVQPILRRLGTDPFSIDMAAFIEGRLLQEFPDLATKSGDATTDLLEKPAILLWDPIVREIQRLRNAQSFKDPTILTIEEAEALAANIFSERNRGNFSRGVARIYFQAAQPISVAPANFITSRTGLHFFPKTIQSIKLEEMLFNVEGSLFYFDVNLIAERAGDEYNIGPDELITIANLTAAIRITNKRKFDDGLPAENAVEFIDRAQQELSERSMVTLRGISAVVPKSFPEVTRLNVVGFNDPEMERDIITGGGLGPIRSFGGGGQSAIDGENKVLTRRVLLTEAVTVATPNGFLDIIGPTNVVPTGWVLTVMNAFGGTPPNARDLVVKAVVSATMLDLEEQVIAQSLSTWSWLLRRSELTLSGIPGGILFPDSPNGTVTIPSGQIHVGGATDILVRGIDFDEGNLVLSAVVDDDPLLDGVDLEVFNSSGLVRLHDYTLGVNYAVDDGVYKALQNAPLKGWTLQILEGPAAGSYRVLSQQQVAGQSPSLTVTPSPSYAASPAFQTLRWKLTDVLDIDLVEPKETKISGSDMFSIQGFDQLETFSGIDFDNFGVAAGDIVRISNGPDAGEYKVLTILAPFYTRVQIDQALKFSTSNLQYQIFRKNSGGGITRPLIRIRSVDLLDTTGQPVGSKVPYALPVDAQSSAFANVGKGVRAEARDGVLGLCGVPLPSGANVNGLSMSLRWNDGANNATIVFVGVNPISLASIVSQINAAVGSTMAVIIDGNRLGLIPFGFTEAWAGFATPILFGGANDQYHHSKEVNSTTIETNFAGGWDGVSPAVDENLDVLQVLSGQQVGFYGSPRLNVNGTPPSSLACVGLTVDHNFAPEVGAFIQFGSRSLGTARVYFLEPTSIEFGADSRFKVIDENGIELNFLPDPTVETQKIPALPSGTKPKDGDNLTIPSFSSMKSTSVDFIKKGIQKGDVLVLDYVPLTGTVNLPDPIPALQFLNLIIAVDGGTQKTVTFLTDSIALPPGAVTRAGVASQINQAVGRTICSIITIGAAHYLSFDVDASVKVYRTGSATATLLGASFTLLDKTNTSDNVGRYNIISVSSDTLVIDDTISPFGFSTNYLAQQFKVVRPATQRLGSTQMAINKAAAGLYYMDVQLVSEGSGDLWNISSDLQMSMSGFDADGYYLSTPDKNLTFSPAEQVTFHVSKSILEIGVSDDPDNATQLAGQNLQVLYDYSSLSTSVNNFALSESERVINDSPLGRHLVPNFVRFDLSYAGGSSESVVIPAVEKLIREVQPQDPLESSDIQQIVLSKGANSILNPLELISVVHNFDRSLTVNRSKDKLTTGRLSAFIPDLLNIKRKLA